MLSHSGLFLLSHGFGFLVLCCWLLMHLNDIFVAWSRGFEKAHGRLFLIFDGITDSEKRSAVHCIVVMEAGRRHFSCRNT